MNLKVGAHTIRVSAMSDQERTDHERVGCYSWLEDSLRIWPGLTVPQQAETLIHELLHVSYELAGMRRGKRDEEDVVEGLDGPLTLIFHDNPEVLVRISLALNNGVPIVARAGQEASLVAPSAA